MNTAAPQRAGLSMWGGVECTVNRVHNTFRSQLVESGHHQRLSDLEQFSALGITRIRYPVLWEMIAPHRPGRAQWQWADARLERLRALRLEPILGLLHHGSGPCYTNLLDHRFPWLFAQYAESVARRYPWVSDYTPINEPLTTARFSCLYGHWYPHARTDVAFARALVNQCCATVLAMRAIRSINANARLIATDDLGETFATSSIQYQAEFDNERRWLGWDLLSGKVDLHHPLRGYLCAAGINSSELDWLSDNACAPNVIGINHYVTSDRMLNEEWERFPEQSWGGNGRHRYADTEAVRALDDYVPGFERTLTQCWQRYRLPVALTEVHLGSEPDEQVRWLHRAWNAATNVAAAGVPVLAVTSWALLGSFDWASLLTRREGLYEAGAYDISRGSPCATDVARCIQQLSLSGAQAPPKHVHDAGWWERDSRITCPVRAIA